MRCKDCGFDNSNDEHRCLRCGRRLTGVVIAAPPGYSGANALAVAAVMARETETLEFEKAPAAASLNPAATSLKEGGSQATLFAPAAPGSNVIPFELRHRQAAARVTPPPPAVQEPQQPSPAARKAVRKVTPPVEQGTLDFIPAAPARNRRLKTDVDAQVFCEQPVATPSHRFVASCVDGGLILVGFSLLVIASEALGGSFGAGKMFWMELAGALLLVSLFYGLIWAIAGRETAGMRFTDLQLITFDGFPLDGRNRALRFAATCLSICSGGLGVLWAMADEENLTWHDHISKTFPTVREDPRSFVKQRR